VWHIACDSLGRYLYLGENHGNLGLWSVSDQDVSLINVQRQPARSRPPSRPKPAAAEALKGQGFVTPPMRICNWCYVAQWQRCYGCEASTRKVIFTFSEDGRSCVFAQPIGTQSNYTSLPQISVKHRK